MKKLKKKIIDDLFNDADKSERKRAHYLLHQSYNDKVQRLLIAFTKGSYVEPHYHKLSHQWEMFVVLNGLLKVTLYDNALKIDNSFFCGDNSDTNIIEFTPGEIHSIECISERALALEIKEGPFNPDYAKNFI